MATKKPQPKPIKAFLDITGVPLNDWKYDTESLNKTTIQRSGVELRYPSDSEVHGFEYTGSNNQQTYNGDSITEDFFVVSGIHISSIISSGTISVIGRMKFDIVRGDNVIFRMTHYHIATNTPQSNFSNINGIVLQRGDALRIVIDHSAGSACTYYTSFRVVGNRVQNL